MSDDLKIFGKNHLGIDGFRVQSIDGTWLTYRKGGKDLRPVADENDVILIDMDGEILYSYTKAEFAQLTKLPTIPTLKYSFLTQDGWNWTLSDAKEYVAKYGELVIGAQYTTTDDKNHCLFDFPRGVTFTIGIYIANAGASSGNTITVDWGDGTTPTTETDIGRNITKTYTHTYSAKGTYDITWTCSNLNSRIVGSTTCLGFCKAIAIKSTSNYYEFYYNGDFIFLAGSTNTAGNMFKYIASPAVIFPRGFVVSYGNSNWFQNMAVTALKYVSWDKEAQYISGSNRNGVLTDYCYTSCRCLRRITALDNTMAMGANTLNNCISLIRFNVPSSVTDIAANALNGCTKLEELHFFPTSPPVVANANAFTNIPTTCKIYVPTGYLTAYKTASNYPDPETYTYVEE